MISDVEKCSGRQMSVEKRSTPELCTLMTISTVHITESTCQFLDDECDPATSITGVCICKKIIAGSVYGWFVYIDSLTEASCDLEVLPEDLRACIKFALDCQASILCFDSDGPVMSQLIAYNI